MGDCCITPGQSQSWIDLQHAKPIDVLALIANAYIGSTQGSFANSSNFGTSATWATNPFTIASNPTCTALGTDNVQKAADALQWTFQHQTGNVGATVPPPMRKVIFLRGGTDWQMEIPLDLGGSSYTDLQLSFRDNSGTRGDAQGTIPVVQWTGSFTGSVTMKVTLKEEGRFVMGLRGLTGSTVNMMEMEWIVVGSSSNQPTNNIQTNCK